MLFWGSWRKGHYKRQPVLGAVEWGAVVKVNLVLALRRRLERRHSRQPEKSWQGAQDSRQAALGAPEAAVREAVEWAAVVKVVVHLMVAVRRRMQRRHSRQPKKSRQGGQHWQRQKYSRHRVLVASEAAVRAHCRWGAVVKVVIHLV